MILTKTAKIFFKNNDIYILENYNNTIIINYDNQGLLLLDNSLCIHQKVLIPQKAPIYHLYKKYDNDNLMLYIPDIDQIIFVNIKTSNNFTIKLPESFKTEILSPNYYWKDNILILVTFNNNLYQFNFTSKILHQISHNEVKKICPSFFAFFDIFKQYNVVKFYPDERSFIFRNNNNTIGYLNCQQNTHSFIIESDEGWHDVEYKNDVFLFVYEKKIEIIGNQDRIILKPHLNYIFLRAKFLNNNHFVILIGNPSNPQENFLEIYKIS
jgi:hypothetical protein